MSRIKRIKRIDSSNKISLVVKPRGSSNLREMSPRSRKLKVSKEAYPNAIQIKKEYPQLHMPNINRKLELICNNSLSKRKLPKPIISKRRENDHLKDLYKIYAPYLNGPSYAKKISIGNSRNEPSDINYYRRIEQYLEGQYKGYNHRSVNNSGPEIKIIPRRKLSPIKRNLIDMN